VVVGKHTAHYTGAAIEPGRLLAGAAAQRAMRARANLGMRPGGGAVARLKADRVRNDQLDPTPGAKRKLGAESPPGQWRADEAAQRHAARPQMSGAQRRTAQRQGYNKSDTCKRKPASGGGIRDTCHHGQRQQSQPHAMPTHHPRLFATAFPITRRKLVQSRVPAAPVELEEAADDIQVTPPRISHQSSQSLSPTEELVQTAIDGANA